MRSDWLTTRVFVGGYESVIVYIIGMARSALSAIECSSYIHYHLYLFEYMHYQGTGCTH